MTSKELLSPFKVVSQDKDLEKGWRCGYCGMPIARWGGSRHVYYSLDIWFPWVHRQCCAVQTEHSRLYGAQQLLQHSGQRKTRKIRKYIKRHHERLRKAQIEWVKWFHETYGDEAIKARIGYVPEQEV